MTILRSDEYEHIKIWRVVFECDSEKEANEILKFVNEKFNSTKKRKRKT